MTYEWVEDDLLPRTILVEKECGPFKRLIDVAVGEAGRARPGDVLRVTGTPEALLVYEAREHQLLCRRGHGTTKRAPIKAGSHLLIIGSVLLGQGAH